MQDLRHDLIFLAPVFKEKVWGGRRLASELGYDIPDGPIGECWAISAHPSGDCAVSGGAWDGKPLSELWRDQREELFAGASGDEFPLLVKVIDADDDLSIQVHPDDAYAAAHEAGSLGKRECWYVLDADAGAHVIVGQHARSRAEFAALVRDDRWDELLNLLPCATGDFFRIEPGTVHAIKRGTLLLEIQQSSDITYRIHDYGRLGIDGRPRELHLSQALDVIDYDAAAPTSGTVTAAEVDGVTHLMTCPSFVVDRVRVTGEKRLSQPWPFLCASVIEGSGTVRAGAAGIEHAVARGAHFLAPAGCGDLQIAGDLTLVTCRLP